MSPVSLASPVSASRTLRLSPLASVRWSGGGIVIVTPSHDVMSAFDDRILVVLQAFAHPRTLAGASQDLRGIPPSLLAIYMATLTDHGVLVDADEFSDTAPAATPDGEGVSALAGSIATLSRTIARDARAMAPYLDERRQSDRGAAVGARLEAVRDALLGLAADLRHARPEYLRQQRRALNLPAGEKSFKLHVGCGGSRLDGWINVDYPPADLAIDLSWPLPFDDNSVTYAYLAHVLEHLDYPAEAGALLEEIHRVLTPGGVLRVVVPDIGKCIR